METSKRGDKEKGPPRRKQSHETNDKKRKEPIQCPFCPKKTTNDLDLIIHFAARHNPNASAKRQTEKEDSTQFVGLIHIH